LASGSATGVFSGNVGSRMISIETLEGSGIGPIGEAASCRGDGRFGQMEA
jgi:hypothetical protein